MQKVIITIKITRAYKPKSSDMYTCVGRIVSTSPDAPSIMNAEIFFDFDRMPEEKINACATLIMGADDVVISEIEEVEEIKIYPESDRQEQKESREPSENSAGDDDEDDEDVFIMNEEENGARNGHGCPLCGNGKYLRAGFSCDECGRRSGR